MSRLKIGQNVICPWCHEEYAITEQDVDDDGFICPECEDWVDVDDLEDDDAAI
jgi:formylmethanofuran dehydrogenase subunit E